DNLTSFTHPELGHDDVVAALASEGYDTSATTTPATAVLLDTFDGRLHDATLRLHLVDGAERALVLEDPGSPPARLSWPGAPPRLGADLPPGPFGARIAGPIAERALLPSIEVGSTRHDVVARD